MTPSELGTLTIAESRRRIRNRSLSSVELTEAVLSRAEALDSMNAFITITRESALARAGALDEASGRDERAGPLHGVPIALKDLIDTRGTPTTAGSLFFRDRTPGTDAIIVNRLHEAGAVIVGKTNLHEFAFGVTNENPHYGPARNPWDRERISGGSSGGSAVAVALSMAIGAIGTDTGGSIRIPAALCGIVGLKPTYGRVPLSGVIPLAPQLDHAGPMTRSVEDAAILLDVIADPGVKALSGLQEGIRDLRIGVPRTPYFDRLEDGVAQAVEQALGVLERLGGVLVEQEVPDTTSHEDIFRLIATSEAFRFHKERLDSRPEDFGEDVRLRLTAGRDMLAVDFIGAERARAQLRTAIDSIFEAVDVLALPTLPITAPRIGQTAIDWPDGPEIVLRALTRNTRLANLTGLPAISVPCAFAQGLPVGLQVMGPADTESRILRVARAYEQEASPSRLPTEDRCSKRS